MTSEEQMQDLTESLKTQAAVTTAEDLLLSIDPSIESAYPMIPKILSAVTEAISSQGEDVTSSSLLCGLLATLEKKETQSKKQICCAVCRCLSIIAESVPRSTLRSQSFREVPLLINILKIHENDHEVVRAAVLCLPRLMAVLNRDNDSLLLSLGEVCLSILAETKDTKTARTATKSVVVMLRRELRTETKSEMCDRIVGMCVRAFEYPLKTAAAASKETVAKTRSRLQDTLDKEVLSMIRILTALPAVLPLTSLNCMTAVMKELEKLFSLQLPEVSVRVCDVFTAVFPVIASLDVKLTKEVVGNVKSVVLSLEASSADLLNAFGMVLHSVLTALQNQNPVEALEMFNFVVSAFLSMLDSEYDEVREKTKQHLVSLLMGAKKATEGMELEEEDSWPFLLCEKFISALDRHHDDHSLPVILPVIKGLFCLLGRKYAFCAENLLLRLGHIYEAVSCDTHNDGIDQGDLTEDVLVLQCIGQAISHFGSEAVLHALPLKITEALEGSYVSEPRTWLLPLIKKHARSDSLQFWMTSMYPTAQAVHAKAILTKNRDQALSFKCTTLEQQLWSTLPSFALWATDTHTVFPSLSQLIGQVFIERPEFRETICLTISRLCACPCRILEISDEGHDDFDTESLFGGDAVFTASMDNIPKHFTSELAQRAIDVLAESTEAWFEIVASGFIESASIVSTKPLSALSSLAQCSSPSVKSSIFQKVKNELYKAFQNTSFSSDRKQERYLDILCSITSSLDASGLEEVIKVAELVIQSKVGHTIQKKGYKLMAFIMQHHPSSWIDKAEEMAMMLKSTCGNCKGPSMHFRMRCIKALLSSLAPNPDKINAHDQAVVVFLPEIVLSQFDACVKAKAQCQAVLIQIGKHYAEWLSSPEDSMVAGSIKSVQCLMEHFGILFAEHLPGLLNSVLKLAKEKQSEERPSTSRSPTLLPLVLDFIQSASHILPVSTLSQVLGEIVGMLLQWDVPMRNAREQTRALLLHLSDLVGFEEVQKYVPEDYSRVMRNLRKTHRRSESKTEPMEIQTKLQGTSVVTSQQQSGASKMASTKNRADRRSVISSVLGRRSQEMSDAAEAVDLLNPVAARRLAKAAAGQEMDAANTMDVDDDGFKLPVTSEGKLIITDRSLKKAEKLMRKRSRDAVGMMEQDDKMTVKSKLSSRKSQFSHPISHGSKRSRITKPSSIKSHQSGRRFKAKKGAGGDAKGSSRLEPYAYWKLDRHLLNKRRGKRNATRNDLRNISRTKNQTQN